MRSSPVTGGVYQMRDTILALPTLAFVVATRAALAGTPTTEGDNPLTKGAKNAGQAIGHGFKKLFGRGQDQDKNKQ
jgi:hypothetical protein